MYKKEINELHRNKDKDIDELNSKIIKEKQSYSNKMIELQKKLREYEIKRSVYTTSKLKQKVISEKDSNEQDINIQRLKQQISTLEKANFMLKIDKRDVIKENDNNLRIRKKKIVSNFGFIPSKSRISTYVKDNKDNDIKKLNELIGKNLSGISKKNLFGSGFSSSRNDNDKELYENDSNSGSIIVNDNDE